MRYGKELRSIERIRQTCTCNSFEGIHDDKLVLVIRLREFTMTNLDL